MHGDFAFSFDDSDLEIPRTKDNDPPDQHHDPSAVFLSQQTDREGVERHQSEDGRNEEGPSQGD